MHKIVWKDGALVIRPAMTAGRFDWSYCGGGPSFPGVTGDHVVAAVESLLGWDHPAACEVRVYVGAEAVR